MEHEDLLKLSRERLLAHRASRVREVFGKTDKFLNENGHRNHFSHHCMQDPIGSYGNFNSLPRTMTGLSPRRLSFPFDRQRRQGFGPSVGNFVCKDVRHLNGTRNRSQCGHEGKLPGRPARLGVGKPPIAISHPLRKNATKSITNGSDKCLDKSGLCKYDPSFGLVGLGPIASLDARLSSRKPLEGKNIIHLLQKCLMNCGPLNQKHIWCQVSCLANIRQTLALVVEGLELNHIPVDPHDATFNKDLQDEVLSMFPYQILLNEGTNSSKDNLKFTIPTLIEMINSLHAVSPDISLGSKNGDNNSIEIEKEGSDTGNNDLVDLEQLEAEAKDSKVLMTNLAKIFPIEIASTTLDNLYLKVPKAKKVKRNDDKFSRVKLLLGPQMMLREGYKFPTSDNRFVPTSRTTYRCPTPTSPMFGLDCEMVLTIYGNELARIAIVDENMDLIMDELVMPYGKILNYVTKFSGITKEMLDGVKTRLTEVQSMVQDLLPPDAILVGQGLCGDLKAMMMTHPYIIDTSVIYNIYEEPNRKSKLKYLSKIFLNEDIQLEHMVGHDPGEDSGAALKLALLKLKNSVTFGDRSQNGWVPEGAKEFVEFQKKYRLENEIKRDLPIKTVNFIAEVSRWKHWKSTFGKEALVQKHQFLNDEKTKAGDEEGSKIEQNSAKGSVVSLQTKMPNPCRGSCNFRMVLEKPSKRSHLTAELNSAVASGAPFVVGHYTTKKDNLKAFNTVFHNIKELYNLLSGSSLMLVIFNCPSAPKSSTELSAKQRPSTSGMAWIGLKPASAASIATIKPVPKHEPTEEEELLDNFLDQILSKASNRM